MTREAKQELARAYNEAVRILEASYAANRYNVSWHEAAELACTDKDLIPLVYAMVANGLSDFADWAEKWTA